jgi:hypothetical protein
MVGSGPYVEQRLDTRGVLGGLFMLDLSLQLGQTCQPYHLGVLEAWIEVFVVAELCCGVMQRLDLARKVRLAQAPSRRQMLPLRPLFTTQDFTKLISPINSILCLARHK